jgi:hypothetical protein
MKHAVEHIHFVGTPGAGPRRSHSGLPMSMKHAAMVEGAK